MLPKVKLAIKAGESLFINDVKGDILNEIGGELKKNNYKTKMLLQVHDELIFEVPNDELESIKELVRNNMEGIYKLSVPLKVEIEYGKDWYDAK